MCDNDKTIRLFKYIEELSKSRDNIITDVDKYPWKWFLKDVPDDKRHIKLFFRDLDEENGDTNVSNDMTLLEVIKPKLEGCPVLPAILNNWIEDGWENCYYSPVIKQIVETGGETETFGESQQRKNTYEKWLKKWEEWAEKRKLEEKTLKLFKELYQAHIDLDRESETLELVLGNGLIIDAQNPEINHPILIKRVDIEFNANKNIIKIVDTDNDPNLYLQLFQQIDDIAKERIPEINQKLENDYYHPLDGIRSKEYLKTLINELSPDGRFIDNEVEEQREEGRFVVKWYPVYFMRKKHDGIPRAIKSIIEDIETNNHVPNHINDLVNPGIVEVQDRREPTLEETLAALAGENAEILLSKEANREQLEIAERIEQHNAVLVQGPPGTGKTHTIANLMGHFLAQGKSVLVTSHTKKALSVLKDQLPMEIQNLCVTMLDDTNKDMKRSVAGICEYSSNHTSIELNRKIKLLEGRRSRIIDELAESRRKTYEIRNKEFKPIIFNGNSYSPIDMAKYVCKNAETLDYIPGNVELYQPLPLTMQELHTLYKSNESVTADDEVELGLDLPNPEGLISPSVLHDDILKEQEKSNKLNQIKEQLQWDIKFEFNSNRISIIRDNQESILADNPEEESLLNLNNYVNTLINNQKYPWMIHAAVDGYRGGGYRHKWELLITAIKDAKEYAEKVHTEMIGKNITFYKSLSSEELKDLNSQINKLEEIYSRKGKVSKLDLKLHKWIETALSTVFINGNRVNSTNDCQMIAKHITLLQKRNTIEYLWKELMTKQRGPEFGMLGTEPEESCYRYISSIEKYLNWYENEYMKLVELLDNAGIHKESLFPDSDLESADQKIKKTIESIENIIPNCIQILKSFILLKDIGEKRNRSILILSEGKRIRSDICRKVANALINKDVGQYEEGYIKLSKIFEKDTALITREKLLEKILKVAPEWANHIRSRESIHGDITCPENIEDAWKWKQFEGVLKDITASSIEELQRKSEDCSKKLREITAELASAKAWYQLMKRIERDQSIRRDLVSWEQTVRRIGKGTGRNAPRYRRQARKLMASCQTAVPAWIMTTNKALENFSPSENTFDIIIIDEASQSSLVALAVLYFGKKIIVVGDDKQVSPMAIGVDIAMINDLQNNYLQGITNAHLFDGKYSIYDIARTTYTPLMLHEHFRCAPEIIGYSNKYSYDNKIKPLRDASNCKVVPPVVHHRVQNGQRVNGKINKREAETIVALIKACIEQPEYDDQTFGVISLLGDEQAKLIQKYILEKIDPQVIEERRILCGNAAHFQGDERDVIFLSMVDNNEGDGPLRRTGEGTDESTKKRYNVATSRAKNQLWVVHSLDHTRDLQENDLRKDLLIYAENPKAFEADVENINRYADSPFESEVAFGLIAKGYNVTPQWRVGAYRIDMVVQYMGNKIAIECDGEKFHNTEEQIQKDMERQIILERTGWKFIRIRGSEFYKNPEATIDAVIKQLQERGIEPEEAHDLIDEAVEPELLKLVKKRATELLTEGRTEADQGMDNNEIVNPEPSLVDNTPSPAVEEKNDGNQEIQINTQALSEQLSIPSQSPDTNIMGLLQSEGFECIKTEKSIFIIGSLADGERIKAIAKQYNYSSNFDNRGMDATKNKPAWQLKNIIDNRRR